MAKDERQDKICFLASAARSQLGCRGVLVIVDWGDGAVGSWLNAAADSPLQDLADRTKSAAMKKAKRAVRNPFYAAIQRDGICFANPVSPLLPHGKRSASNPYYARVMAAGGVCIGAGRMGRPSRDEKARPTVVKSVRLPPEVWARVRRQAAREQIPVNAAVRQAILIWLQS